MLYTLTVNRTFPASHNLFGHDLCGKPHGHTYRVEVTVIGDPEPETFNMVANDIELTSAIDLLLVEVSRRDLNAQLPAVIPSVQGIASWIWERLALRFQLYEVTVWQDDLSATVRREY